MLSLVFMNDLVVEMIEISLNWSFLAPFIVHWVGFGMLTIALDWTAWLDITLWILYFVYGAGEIFLAMMFAPSIWDWIASDPLTTTAIEEEVDVALEVEE